MPLAICDHLHKRISVIKGGAGDTLISVDFVKMPAWASSDEIRIVISL